MAPISCTRRGLFGMAIPTFLTACSSPAPRVHTLTAVSGGAVGGRPLTASVALVDIPKYLDRPQIVRRLGSVEFGLNEFER
jgi:uncharacterized lipoprotein YmbA